MNNKPNIAIFLLYLRHVEADSQLKGTDHNVDDRCPCLVCELAGVPGSLVPDCAVSMYS